MSHVVLDDHLLRDLLVDTPPAGLKRILRTRTPATTNLFYLRLCRSVVGAAGGSLTGSWPVDRRRALGRTLTALPDDIRVISMRAIAFDMAEVANDHGLSSLGAEAIAACQVLDAPLYVAESDDGPRIRAAAGALGIDYRTVAHSR